MIQDAILGKPHECIYAAADDPGAPIIYVTDAARAADMILQAPKNNIKMVNYCVSGIRDALSVNELETVLKRRYPKTEITYRAPVGGLPVSVIKKFDDSCARKEWEWKPLYDSPEAIIDKFERDVRERARYFGLA